MNFADIIKRCLPVLICGTLLSCTTPPAPVAETALEAAVVWPPAPDEPRIAFAGYLKGPGDIGERQSALRNFGNWLTGAVGEDRNLRKPFAVAVDEESNLCIADTETNVICYADFARRKWKRYEGVGKTRFASPVAVARHKGVFYVADSQLAKVFAFDDNGRALFELGAPLQRPVGLAVGDDRIYVVDVIANAVFAFQLDGKFISQFGARGTEPGEFNYPTCAAVDRNGNILVTDTLNCRVQVIDRDGRFLSQFGSMGDTSGHFARPKGVAVDEAGNIYVVDAMFGNFQIFDPAGRLLLNVGQSGAGAGEFGLPAGIAIGANGRIYVADAFNHRVQVFQTIGRK